MVHELRMNLLEDCLKDMPGILSMTDMVCSQGADGN